MSLKEIKYKGRRAWVCKDCNTLYIYKGNLKGKTCPCKGPKEQKVQLIEKLLSKEDKAKINRKKLAKYVPLQEGVGKNLSNIFSSIGIFAEGCGGCYELMVKMNNWGIDGCREHKKEIVAELKQRASTKRWTDVFKAIAKTGATGLAFKMPSWTNPYSSFVDMAINTEVQKQELRNLEVENLSSRNSLSNSCGKC